MTQPTLSIVVSTREGIPEYWIEALLKINGDIEDNPPEYRRTKRFYVFAELLLLKNNPQYGYL